MVRPLVVAILVAMAPAVALLSCGSSSGGSAAGDAGGDAPSQEDATMDGSGEPEAGGGTDATMKDAGGSDTGAADVTSERGADARAGADAGADADASAATDSSTDTSPGDAGDEGDGYVFEPPDTGPYPEASCPMDAGAAVALATGETSPTIIATDGAVAFWLDSVSSTTSLLRSCAVAGCNGAPFTLTIAGPIAFDSQIAVDDTNVYWTDSSKHVWSCAKTGCSAPTAVVNNGSRTIGVASDGNNLFWADTDLQHVSTCALPACATQTALVSGQFPNSLQIDSTTVYWTVLPQLATGRVWSCAKTGCGNMPTGIGISQFADDPMPLTVNATDAYWVEWGATDGYIETCPKGGCAGGPNNAAKVVHLSFTSPFALAADDTDIVYWADDTDIMSCPKVGCTGQGTSVATGQSGARTLVIDRRTGCQSTVFWANTTGGQVMALPL